MRIVVGAAAFFELSDDDVLDADVAVKQLEWIASELQQLEPSAKDAVLAFVAAEAQGTTDARYRAFLSELPEGLGLREA